jgi:hypothetical protein
MPSGVGKEAVTGRKPGNHVAESTTEVTVRRERIELLAGRAG